MGGRGGFRNQGRGGGGGGGGNMGMMFIIGYRVYMRGLSYVVKESDVKQFFMFFNLVNVWMEYLNGFFNG